MEVLNHSEKQTSERRHSKFTPKMPMVGEMFYCTFMVFEMLLNMFELCLTAV